MNFDTAFAFVVGEEGGYVNNPADPGGETKFGITKKAYPGVDIPSLTVESAKAIYQRDYWEPLGLDPLPYGTSVCQFDCAVNQGIGRAIVLRNAIQDGPDFVIDFQAERALYYAKLETFPTFGRGWMRRLLRTTVEANRGVQ